ncbi:metallophosphoesterase [Caldibacillus lycopersici]|uniref:Metallophosphoesterase n=1 Tax=Perspicuibacillus lycopersici TaxID=1325689 RepID=A0AAE3LLQ1_9BACI|nr:metallophosphoesterase [Perspicuibacillus lycopersici]MCU9611982.1 metallophosphoesterase [Perspicuibacillus lycopersici]
MYFIGLSIIAVLLLLFMWKEAFRNHVSNQVIHLENLPESFSDLHIFFISDIHRRLIHQDIIEQVKGKVDIVIIGGDLTERGVPFSRTKENIQRLNVLGPVYFVWGNNDFEVNNANLRRELISSNVKILENSHATLRSQTGEKIYLIGVGEISFELDRLDIALENIDDPNGFKIVICHNPEIVDQITPADNIPLVLSGHTHGGQINFFGLGLYPIGKLHHLSFTNILISNGYGTTKLPLRLCARAECHLIKISKN